MSPTDLKNRHPAIPLPAGACTAGDWIDVGGDSPLRYFECRRRIIARRDPDDELADIEVYVAGMQRTDGSADPEICVHQLHRNMPIQSVRRASHFPDCGPNRFRSGKDERNWQGNTRNTSPSFVTRLRSS
jgi:hypothetical protein